MNYFAHGRDFVGNPYFLAGTAVPDWLNVSDRGVRVRAKHALPFCADADPRLAALARGIIQHHRDDAWFHEQAWFAEANWRLAALVRETMPNDDGLRPSFLGHILVEILLDAALIAQTPHVLEAYYAAMESLDPEWVQAAVGRLSPGSPQRLGRFVTMFHQERFLWDYSDDGKLCYRLNQVMRRVQLAPLPEAFGSLLPEARLLVARLRPNPFSPPREQLHLLEERSNEIRDEPVVMDRGSNRGTPADASAAEKDGF